MAVYLGSKAVSVYNGGQIAPEEKTVTAGTSPIEVNSTSGKLMSKVTVNPTPTEEKTVTPTTEDLIVAPVEGKQLSQVTVQGDVNFLEENIAEGVTIWGKIGTHQGGGGSGSYVWTKQGMSDTVTEDTTGGTYTLTTSNDSRPSSEIEICISAPIYDSSKRQWNFDSTLSGYMKGTVSNEDTVLPPIGVGQWPSEIYVRVTSEPNIWYLVTEFGIGSSNPYMKSMTYSAKYIADVDWAKRYLTDKVENTYPLDAWLGDGYYYKQVINDPNRIDGGVDWIGSNITDKTFYSICYGNNLWIAGNWDTIYYSIDGKNWKPGNMSTNIKAKSLCYGKSIYVAGTRYKGLWYSTDGINWTQSNVTSNASFENVYFGGDIFIASDAWDNGTSPTGIYYSTDGITWTKSNLTSGTFSCISYNNGIWVGTGTATNDEGSYGIYYSTNGKTWTTSNITSGWSYNDSICYADGTWVVTSSGGLYKSTDGKSWSRISSFNNSISHICNLNGVWIISDDSGGILYRSTDLNTFTKVTINTEGYIYAMTTFNLKFIIGYSRGTYYSTDGENWILADNNSYESLCSNSNIIIVGVGNNNTSGLYYSESKSIEIDF